MKLGQYKEINNNNERAIGNRVFENGKELVTSDELGRAFYAIIPEKYKRHPYELERIKGDMCDCYGKGIFDLYPIDDEGVQSGGKRYMKCRICGCISHL